MAFEFKLPDVGEGVVEGEIVRWLIGAGERVKEDQPLVEVMTDKATVEIPSPVEGRVVECIGGEGDLVKVGATLVVIETATSTPEVGAAVAAVSEAPAEKAMVKTHSKAQAAGRPRVLATPAVRKLARERGIELADVKGTGPGGRITAQDLEGFTAIVRPQLEETGKPTSDELMPYRGVRRKIGEHLSLSKQKVAHYTYVEEADVTELVSLRKAYLQFRGDEARLTYLPFIMKAVVAGLKQFPLLNAVLDEENGQILLKKVYHIGLATATAEGLIVPVVRDVDKKSILDLIREIETLAEWTREGAVKLEDLQGSTFTITSLGALGGLMATPIVNYPEVAILGVHRIIKRPVVKDDRVVIREIMNLSISLDHRVVDGVIAAEFLQYVIRLLEQPGLMFLVS